MNGSGSSDGLTTLELHIAGAIRFELASAGCHPQPLRCVVSRHRAQYAAWSWWKSLPRYANAVHVAWRSADRLVHDTEYLRIMRSGSDRIPAPTFVQTASLAGSFRRGVRHAIALDLRRSSPLFWSSSSALDNQNGCHQVVTIPTQASCAGSDLLPWSCRQLIVEVESHARTQYIKSFEGRSEVGRSHQR